MVIICTAKLANTMIGHIDHAMAYAAGFKQLGHDVYLMEHVGPQRCKGRRGYPVPFQEWEGRTHFEAIAKAYGLWPNSCLIYKNGEATHGMTFSEAKRIAKRCNVLLTRSGTIHKVPAIFEPPQQRVYVDGNPGSTQVFFDQRDEDYAVLDHYEHLFTMGLNVGHPTCPLPTSGRQWRSIMRPVDLSRWPASTQSDPRPLTTISTWKGRTTFEFNGLPSGDKSENWLRFIELPRHTKQEMEIAMRFPHGCQDRNIFTDQGWKLFDPDQLQTLDALQGYIDRSRGEWSVAHHRYVQFRTGWFSDRSALYLAAGKPVLVQSTGIESHLPTGQGLLTFTTMEEALAGIDDINRNYSMHCRAAREIGETFFNAQNILTNMLEALNC